MVTIDEVTPELTAARKPSGARTRTWRPMTAAAMAVIGLVGIAVAYALAADAGVDSGADVIRVVLGCSFVGAVLVMVRQRVTTGLALVVAGAVSVSSVEFVSAVLLRRGQVTSGAELIESLAAPIVITLGLHVLLALPDGRLAGQTQGRAMVGAYAVAVAVGVARWQSQPDPPSWPLLALILVWGAAGLAVSNKRYVQARGAARRRMQWVGLGMALSGEVALLVTAGRLFIGWPEQPLEVMAASLVLVAAGLAAGAIKRLVGLVDRLIVHAVSVAGLSALVVGIYLLVVVGLGRVPEESERSVLGLSVLAAAVAGVAFPATNSRLTAMANVLVYGAERDPTEALETFGSRMTRALPMDELLLQLVELLKKHMELTSAEVWSGTDGQLERAASVPDRGSGVLQLGDSELPVVTRAGVSGRTWAAVWLPSLADDGTDAPMRVAPMANTGALYGLIVVRRRPGHDDFNDEEERVLADLARQVGLALKNSSLDTALQATLAEVQRANEDLRASRARIVSTAESERRKLERDIHDGAQQRLVALAVKLRLVQRIVEKDMAAALSMLEEARNDTVGAVEELRALAHGLIPPLLKDKGLPDALQAAATRAALPTTVETDVEQRFAQEIETAVYFCCMEAMQNAGKHAGEGASMVITLGAADGELSFSVVDDGAGFELGGGATGGHGFVNMSDRVGALGGTLTVWSAPGQGTRIEGRLPVPAS